MDRIEGTGTEADRGKKMYATSRSVPDGVADGSGTSTMESVEETRNTRVEGAGIVN